MVVKDALVPPFGRNLGIRFGVLFQNLLWKGSGRFLEGFGEGFGRVWEGFCDGLGSYFGRFWIRFLKNVPS